MRTLGTNWAGGQIKRETALNGPRIARTRTRAQRLEKIKKEAPHQLGLIWLLERELDQEVKRKERLIQRKLERQMNRIRQVGGCDD
jgi:hypothetical protein